MAAVQCTCGCRVRVVVPDHRVNVVQPSDRVRVVQQGGAGGIPYEGAYEATPTQETQTFATSGKVMRGDFVVQPIPSNYGLITWDGSVLTVS